MLHRSKIDLSDFYDTDQEKYRTHYIIEISILILCYNLIITQHSQNIYTLLHLFKNFFPLI